MPDVSLITRARYWWAEMLHRRRFLRSVRHLHGPVAPDTPPDAVVVVALVRDGMYFLDEFLTHYRRLGAAQFVFCDNGSSDGTIERLKTEPDTVILQSLLPWGEIENDLRRLAAERYAPGRWCLYADMDELFDFEGADQIGLPGLTRYLQAQGHTALVAQMLEMFPSEPLFAVTGLSYAQAVAAFDWYDLRQVLHRSYHDPETAFSWYLRRNTLSDPRIEMLFGGTRKRVFGEDCCLTKHPLVHVGGGVQPGVHPHAATGVSLADFTALIRHYKFAGNVAARDADTVARGAIPHGEDRARLARFERDADLTLWSGEAQRFSGLGPLYDQGFLIRSPAFTRYLEEERS